MKKTFYETCFDFAVIIDTLEKVDSIQVEDCMKEVFKEALAAYRKAKEEWYHGTQINEKDYEGL